MQYRDLNTVLGGIKVLYRVQPCDYLLEIILHREMYMKLILSILKLRFELQSSVKSMNNTLASLLGIFK